MDKQNLLLKLAQDRKTTRWTGYGRIGDYHNGRYECDFVSPYTKSAGNVDAEIFVLLQDWSSDKSLRGSFDSDCELYGLTRKAETTKNLIELLRSHFSVELGDVYGTNLFPFIKSGNMNSYIPKPDLYRAAKEFALPQIRIVEPKLVICLGFNTFNAIRRVCGHKLAPMMNDAVASPFTIDKSRIWCQAHTGKLGQKNRGLARVAEDWRKMKIDFAHGA